MGKDHDLLEAARSGNVAVIEKLLSHRFRRAGPLALAPLASLRRTANPNCQDQSGETPLHHAALNGHGEAVCSLVRFEASTNIMDNKGCFPLHLAAFNGHADICKILLTQGPSIAKVNEQNHEGDTPLHYACQFGHSEVVNIILQHAADATICNLKNESPLDLASQYGRLETVQMLLRKNPSLLNNSTHESCSLHLAARHGHLNVVHLLLDSGMDINVRTDKGSALQEAAFFGRIDVVQLLLQRGIDTQSTDSGNKTVLDQLTELDSQRSLDIGKVILNHIEGKETPNNHLLRQKRDTEDLICLSVSTENSSLDNDHSSVIYTKSQRLSAEKASLKSIGSRESIISSNSQSAASLLDENMDPIYDTPAHLGRPLSIPKGSKRRSDGSDLSESPNGSPQSNYLSCSPKGNMFKNADTPKKPPRRKLQNNLSKIVQSDVDAAFLLHQNGRSEGHSKEDQVKRRASMPGSTESQPDKSERTENNNNLSKEQNKESLQAERPPSLNLADRRSQVTPTPLSPTGYDQPPTPDHPPPSPTTAEFGIAERIQSVTQHEKRMSKDMETITEKQYFLESLSKLEPKVKGHSKGTAPEPPIVKRSPRQRRAASHIETPTPAQRDMKRISAPVISSTQFDSLKEEVKVTKAQLKDKRMKPETALDENEEWAQISDILSTCGGRMSVADFKGYEYFEERLKLVFAKEQQDIMASVGGGFDLESVLVREWEDAFASTFGQGSKGNVTSWLKSLGLTQYENSFLANGFDDLAFMGSTILEEQDLLEIGILDAAHRTLLIESCRALPQLKPIEEVTAQSVQQWLQSLNLTVYWDRFKSHNFTEMSRIQKMWDLELNNVLDIRPLGHRKRMLASLRQLSSEGESSGEEFKDFTRTLNWNYVDDPEELNLFKDYTNLKPHSKPDQVPENVDLRPPQVSTETNIQEWRHQPEVLIRGTCRYSAQYLGSTLVKDLQGTESTKEAIVKMKKSTESLCKVPTIILCISYKGVKFIDAKDKETEHVICEHEINNIFCACQDGENLNFFAYITKDHAQHYCHVFSVRNTELATEIILTLGEAFEVAYQVAVRAASQTPSTPALDGLHEETQPDVTSAEVPATSSSE